MARISHDHRTGTAAIGSINQSSLFAGIGYDPFDRCRLRADDRDDSVGRDNIAKSDIDQLNVYRSHRLIAAAEPCRKLFERPFSLILSIKTEIYKSMSDLITIF